MKTVYRDGITAGKEEIEIATLQIDDIEGFFKVDNAEDLALLIESMGWESVQQFEADTGSPAAQLIGKFWLVAADRIFLKGGDSEGEDVERLRYWW